MREIIFRGKNLESEKWVYGDLMENTYIFGKNDLYCLDSYEVDKETIGQYIGLQDKNGTRIFEGDILYVRYEDKNEVKGYYETYNEVVFKNGAFGIIGENTGEFLSFDYLSIDKEVVVGNIHDNRNLLE